MEKLTNNPGLQHVAEEIFLNLTSNEIEMCMEVNKKWRAILKNPYFWLHKCSLQNETIRNDKKAWGKAIQLKKPRHLEEDLIHHLKQICIDQEKPFSASNIQQNFPIFWAARIGNADFIKELAHFYDDPNVPCHGETPTYVAARNGHANIIKVLAPLTDNPNAPDEDGNTPLHVAAMI